MLQENRLILGECEAGCAQKPAWFHSRSVKALCPFGSRKLFLGSPTRSPVTTWTESFQIRACHRSEMIY